MLVGALLLYQHTSGFLAGAAHAEGTVTSLVSSGSSGSGTLAPVFQFAIGTGERVEVTGSVASRPPRYIRGEKVDVVYDPGRPQEARINDFFSLWGAAVIVGGFGGVFFLIGAGMMLAGGVTRRHDASLLQTGTAVATKFQSVELNRSLDVNGSCPFRVVTQWLDPATSEVHVFKSHDLWFDPTAYIKRSDITVYIARGNQKHYYVDLSFLPKLAE